MAASSQPDIENAAYEEKTRAEEEIFFGMSRR
jgi:hypothetical protein